MLLDVLQEIIISKYLLRVKSLLICCAFYEIIAPCHDKHCLKTLLIVIPKEGRNENYDTEFYYLTHAQ